MNDLKIGDWVENVRSGATREGQRGKIISIDSYEISVKYESGQQGLGKRSDYKFISAKKSFMEKLSTIASKLLDDDTKTLVEAGFLDAELNPTTEGLDQNNALSFMANKTDLVAAAKAKIAAKKACKGDN